MTIYYYNGFVLDTFWEQVQLSIHYYKFQPEVHSLYQGLAQA